MSEIPEVNTALFQMNGSWIVAPEEIALEMEKLRKEVERLNSELAFMSSACDKNYADWIYEYNRASRLTEALGKIAQTPQDDHDADCETWLEYADLVLVARAALDVQ